MKLTNQVRQALKAAGIDTPAPAKYRSVRTEVGGVVYDSKREAAHAVLLEAMERNGLIRDLRRQVAYPLAVNGVVVCRYVADFVYHDTAAGAEAVVDVKGVKTAVYKIKKKLMLAVYGIQVKEV
jgi:hypothetical protein